MKNKLQRAIRYDFVNKEGRTVSILGAVSDREDLKGVRAYSDQSFTDIAVREIGVPLVLERVEIVDVVFPEDSTAVWWGDA